MKLHAHVVHGVVPFFHAVDGETIQLLGKRITEDLSRTCANL
jgi:hypothetical protein